jgi:hypothetical protein
MTRLGPLDDVISEKLDMRDRAGAGPRQSAHHDTIILQVIEVGRRRLAVTIEYSPVVTKLLSSTGDDGETLQHKVRFAGCLSDNVRHCQCLPMIFGSPARLPAAGAGCAKVSASRPSFLPDTGCRRLYFTIIEF